MNRLPILFLPLRFSIPGIIFLFGSILGLVSFQQEVSSSYSRVEKQMTQQTRFAGTQTSGLLEYQYRYRKGKGDDLGDDLIVSQIGAAPLLKLALLTDENNRILLSTRFELRQKHVKQTTAAPSLPYIKKTRKTQGGQVIISADRQSVWAIYPVILGTLPGEILPSRLGILLLKYDLSRLKKQAWNDAAKSSLLYSSAIAILSTILWLLFDKILTERVNKLVTASQDLARGNLDARANLQGLDELSQISTAFDQMAAEIQKNTETLHQNQELKHALSRLRKTQAQLIQAEKMSSLGQMVAGIAHEINNPIGFIHTNIPYLEEYSQDLFKTIQLYQQYYPQPIAEIEEHLKNLDLDFLTQDLHSILQSLRKGTLRISDIVVNLRNFSRLDEAKIKEVDIHEGIENSLFLLKHRLKVSALYSEIKIIKNYSNLPKVNCYPSQLNQVFTHILNNSVDALRDLNSKAVDFLPTFPVITIKTELVNVNKLNIVRIIIADNGVGMSTEIRDRIFDPFFTTKPVGSGTGLGLSISYQIIVDMHNGKLTCNSELGKGTEVLIEIPIKESLVID